MKKIYLDNTGNYAIVDDIDFDYLNRWKWYERTGYAVREYNLGKRYTVYMHHLAIGIFSPFQDKFEVDHMNVNRLDNRRENLRIVSKRENRRNVLLRKDNKSGYKGVTFDKRTGRWIAQCSGSKRGIRGYVGRFRTKEEAALAYNKVALEVFGEFARLNTL